MGATEETQQLVQAAVDTIRWIDADTADVTVDGRSCRIGVVHLRGARASGTARQTRGVEILVSLGQRPIRLDLGARGVTVPSMPTRPTGDAAFDDRFVVQGIPVEACAAAFDADVRRWALDRFTEWPSLRTEDDDLRLFHQTVSDTPGWTTSPEELRAAIQWTLHIADRLASEFDRQQDQVRRSSGQAAADEWVADVHGSLERRDRNRTLIRVLVFGVLAVLLPLVFIWMSLPGR